MSPSKKSKKPRYSKELIYAVKYLAKKGFNSREIAERLDVSPFTVNVILWMLRKSGELPRRFVRRGREEEEEEETEEEEE